MTAYVVAYDAARHAAVALLAEQNLRVTAEGGHLAVDQALNAQFGGVFSSFSRLRRRRKRLLAGQTSSNGSWSSSSSRRSVRWKRSIFPVVVGDAGCFNR